MSSAALQKLLDGPAMKPPLGIKPNFTDPPNFRTAMLVVEVIFLVIPTLAIFMRLYTKARINRNVTLDDYLCVLSFAVYVGLYVPARIADNPAGARHQWDVQVKDMKTFLYNYHIGSIMYGCIVFTIKASILLQYINIFSTADRGKFFWICHTLIWLNFVFYTSCFFLEIFSCKPLAKAWDPLIETGTCIDTRELNTASAAINVISDLTIVLLPQPLVWRLHMDTRKKVAVSAVFSAAILACVSAAIRLYYCVRLSNSEDITWYASMMGTYMFPELGLCFVISCLPSIPKFLRTTREVIMSSQLGSGLQSLLGQTNNRITRKETEDSVKINKGGAKPKPRIDSFDRLVEEHELQSQFRDTSVDGRKS